MRVAPIYDQTSLANTALDSGQLQYPLTTEPGMAYPDSLVVVFDPSAAIVAGVPSVGIFDLDVNVNQPVQVCPTPADGVPHSFSIGFHAPPAVGRTLSANLAYVPPRCKVVVPALGVGITAHLKIYAVYGQ